jgi:hypothetical protein
VKSSWSLKNVLHARRRAPAFAGGVDGDAKQLAVHTSVSPSASASAPRPGMGRGWVSDSCLAAWKSAVMSRRWTRGELMRPASTFSRRARTLPVRGRRAEAGLPIDRPFGARSHARAHFFPLTKGADVPRNCRVCVDSRREEIDSAIAGGASIPKVAAEFGLPESNLYRHRKDHLTAARSITTSRAGGVVATVERLEELDRQLTEIQEMAKRRGHTQAAVAALNQRIRVVMEISAIRDEVRPKEKRVVHVHLGKEEAERIAMSYMRHQQLTGGSSEAERES